MINKKDDLKTLIVIVVVCVICVVIVLILNIKSNTDSLEAVDEYNVFFSNVNYVNNYINCIANNDYNCVYGLLDENYIEENNIMYNNVFDYVDDYSIGSSIRVSSMDYVQINDNFLYYVKGSIYLNEYDSVEVVDDDFSIVIMSDFDNLTYSLYPIDNDYEDVVNGVKKISIDVNDYNGVSKSELITKEQICVVYLSDFLNYITSDINGSYGLLNDDIKKRYSSFDDYKEYVTSNINLFSSIVDRCRMEEVDDKRVYTVIDNNENTYNFYENSIMNYEVNFYLKESE